MAYQVALLNFEGPLDLLLQLVERARLDASELALADLTEQYLAYVNALAVLDAAETARFSNLAAKLLFIKSAGLLPDTAPEAEEATEELQLQLAEYGRYQRAAQELGRQLRDSQRLWSRQRAQPARQAAPPTNLTLATLRGAYRQALARSQRITDHQVPARPVSLEQMTDRLERFATEAATSDLDAFFASLRGPNEVVVAFLAALELWRQRRLALVQSGHFTLIKLEVVDAAVS